jgi:hypothetical protein
MKTILWVCCCWVENKKTDLFWFWVFILVVASCECQATHVFDEMLVRKCIAFKKKFFDEMDRLALEMNL